MVTEKGRRHLDQSYASERSRPVGKIFVVENGGSKEENTMKIQINTDHNINSHQELAAHVTSVVENALRHFNDHITRVEVHLRDENSNKTGPNDKRCMMEARLEGRQPVVVTHHASTVEQAVDGAADKLTHLIESDLLRLRDLRRQPAES